MEIVNQWIWMERFTEMKHLHGFRNELFLEQNPAAVFSGKIAQTPFFGGKIIQTPVSSGGKINCQTRVGKVAVL